MRFGSAQDVHPERRSPKGSGVEGRPQLQRGPLRLRPAASAQRERFRCPAALLLFLLLLCACHAERDDFERFCHAHERAGIVDSDSAGDKAVKISRWLSENLKTQAAKDVLERLPKLEPSQKRQALTAAASAHGVTPCPLADVTWPP